MWLRSVLVWHDTGLVDTAWYRHNIVTVRGSGGLNTWHWALIQSFTLLFVPCVLLSICLNIVGRDCWVSVVTRYGLGGVGIESRWGARFSAPIQTGPGTHPASYTVGTGSFLGDKVAGRGIDHPPPSSTEVRERVELYLYSPFMPSWSVLGWALPLPLFV